MVEASVPADQYPHKRFLLQFVLLLASILSSCASRPASYPPPPQYPGGRHSDLDMLLQVGRPNWQRAVVRDMPRDSQIGGWTGAHPAFQFTLSSVENLDFYLSFAVNERTFRDTGPVTLTVRINGEVIDKPKFDAANEYEYSHPVPSALLRARSPVIAEVDVDPPWIAPEKSVLGVVLFSAGFVEHEPQ